MQHIAITTILKILNEATKKLPELKYAWGVVGLSAVAAFAIKINGNGKAAVIAGSLTLVGMVLMILISTVAQVKQSLLAPSAFLIWAITVFFVTFLGFTVTAYAASWPCNWVFFLEIPVSSASCLTPAKKDNLIDYNRTVDFSALSCDQNGNRNDTVIITDVVKFIGEPPSVYRRSFDTPGTVKIKDLVLGQYLIPKTEKGGALKYGEAPLSIDKETGEAKIEWTYINSFLGDEEGVGFTAIDNYLIRHVRVNYIFPENVTISNRQFSPADFESKCVRTEKGYFCNNLFSGKMFKEVWLWDIWKKCPHI